MKVAIFFILIMVGIYKITSPSNKVYIGQSIDIEKRFSYYKRLSCKQQSKVYNSILKYGYENHVFEINKTTLIQKLNGRNKKKTVFKVV